MAVANNLDKEMMVVWKALFTASEHFAAKGVSVVDDRYPAVTYSDLCTLVGKPVSQRTLQTMIRNGSVFFRDGGYSLAEQWDSEREAKRG